MNIISTIKNALGVGVDAPVTEAIATPVRFPIIEMRACPRCMGTGIIPAYMNIEAGICFQCRGTRTVPYYGKLDQCVEGMITQYPALKSRILRAKALVLDNKVRKIDDNQYTVISSDGKNSYNVYLNTHTCECPDGQSPKSPCKHRIAVFVEQQCC